MNNILVYRHKTLDTHEVFYIGIGNSSRPYKKSGRTRYWKNIVNKHNYYVEILQKNLSWDTACELEKLLIQEYGRRDLGTGCLVNMTDGGDGVRNYKFSREMVEKIATKNRGRKHTEQQNIDKSKRQLGQGGKKVLNTLTNKIYLSVIIAAREVNIPVTTLRRYLDTNSNKTILKYL